MKYWEGKEESLFLTASAELIKSSMDEASFPCSFLPSIHFAIPSIAGTLGAALASLPLLVSLLLQGTLKLLASLLLLASQLVLASLMLLASLLLDVPCCCC